MGFGAVLSEQQLERLKAHKYSTQGKSFLEYYLNPFWEWAVTLFPMWFAPNLMTFVGFLANITTAGIIMYLSPDAKSYVAPVWYLLCVLGLFIGQTMDACDGKQARRTGASSPLGELLDHGCDSVSSVVFLAASFSAIRIGEYPLLFMLQMCMGSFIFYSAHWQVYISGTMKIGIIDVTELQFYSATLLLSGAFADPKFFQNKIFGIALKCWPVIATVVSAIILLFTYVQKSKNGKIVCEGSVLAPLFPATMMFLPSFGIYFLNPNYFLNHPMLYMTVFCLVSVKLTLLIIVSHMTKSQLPQVDQIYLVPLGVLIHHFTKSKYDVKSLLHVCLAVVIIDIICYSTRVCLQICDYLKIHMFKITPK